MADATSNVVYVFLQQNFVPDPGSWCLRGAHPDESMLELDNQNLLNKLKTTFPIEMGLRTGSNTAASRQVTNRALAAGPQKRRKALDDAGPGPRWRMRPCLG